MKFVCLGYADEKKWQGASTNEYESILEENFAYDDELAKNGHIVGGHALQGSRTAKTLRHQNGKMLVIDGPYAETKEQLGGVLVFTARDMNHAIELMSKHPCVRIFGGPLEIRPADEEMDVLGAAAGTNQEEVKRLDTSSPARPAASPLNPEVA